MPLFHPATLASECVSNILLVLPSGDGIILYPHSRIWGTVVTRVGLVQVGGPDFQLGDNVWCVTVLG